jgi:hypothetical protein
MNNKPFDPFNIKSSIGEKPLDKPFDKPFMKPFDKFDSKSPLNPYENGFDNGFDIHKSNIDGVKKAPLDHNEQMQRKVDTYQSGFGDMSIRKPVGIALGLVIIGAVIGSMSTGKQRMKMFEKLRFFKPHKGPYPKPLW